MDATNILDQEEFPNVEKLTNFQLIGILEEKVIYEDHIYKSVQEELHKRNLSSNTQTSLKADYNQEIIGTYTANTALNFIIIAIVLFICGQFTTLVIGGVIYFCSIRAIQLRTTLGKQSMELFWNRLNYSLLILIALLCSISFFL